MERETVICLLVIALVLCLVFYGLHIYSKFHSERIASKYAKYHKSLKYIATVIERAFSGLEEAKILSLKPLTVRVYNPFNRIASSQIELTLHPIISKRFYVRRVFTHKVGPGVAVVNVNLVPIGHMWLQILIEDPREIYIPLDILGKEPFYKLYRAIEELLSKDVRRKINGGHFGEKYLSVESIVFEKNGVRRKLCIVISSINSTHSVVRIGYVFDTRIRYDPKIHGNVDVTLISANSSLILLKVKSLLVFNATITWSIDGIPLERLCWCSNLTEIVALRESVAKLNAVIRNALLTKGTHRIQLNITAPDIRIVKTIEVKIDH